jgi:hypothetical protein
MWAFSGVFDMRFIGLLIIASLLPVPAHATDPAKPEERKVCKREKKTGTRFTTKICKTAAEWETITEQSRRDIGELINRPQINTGRGN